MQVMNEAREVWRFPFFLTHPSLFTWKATDEDTRCYKQSKEAKKEDRRREEVLERYETRLMNTSLDDK